MRGDAAMRTEAKGGVAVLARPRAHSGTRLGLGALGGAMLGVLRGSMMHLCGRFVDEGRVGREERDQDVDL